MTRDGRVPASSNRGVRLPRALLLPLSAALAAAAYYLILFTDHGDAYRGGRPIGTVAFDAAVVLAAFACWEVFRTERTTPVRALAAAVGGPLALFVLATIVYGLRRHVPL